MVITTFKYRPLLPAGAAEESFKPERVLKRLEREVLKKIRGHLTQTTLSPRAKRALAMGLKVEVLPRSLRVTAVHPGFGPLVEGMDEQQMTWLVKATRPIPIITDEGELIFRSATPRSMADGKWIHPGHAKTTVIEKARAEARKVIKNRLQKELTKALGNAGR